MEQRTLEFSPGVELAPVTKTVTQEQIIRYAAASGDFNPLHVDSEYAATTRFGGTIAHGMLVLAFVSEMLTATFGERWLSSGRLKIRFRGAARPRDTITCRGRVVKSGPVRTLCTVECVNQDGEILLSGDAEVNT
jgi:3-hydroxybutyryl-CoA dehydratase